MHETLIDDLGACWQRGWQPHDLMWVVGNDFDSATAGSLAAAILVEAGRYDGPVLDPRWQLQLDRLADDQQMGALFEHHAAVLSALLGVLPTLPKLIPPPGEAAVAPLPRSSRGHTLDDRILQRVRALLAKAESTTFPQEAESLSAKAHELMARHAIDQVLLAAGSQQGEPVARRIHIDNPYLNPKVMLLSEVGLANRCRVVWHKRFRIATAFGFESDLEATEVLFTSLLVQATSAMLAARPAYERQLKSFRSSFLIAYGQRIGERLGAINAAAVADADDGSLLPVLASREDAVDAAAESAFPHLSALRVSMSNGGGLLAGRAAADRADLHRQRVGGPSGLLDRT